MDTATRASVADLVRQRGACEISREDFFERLATLQLPPNGDASLENSKSCSTISKDDNSISSTVPREMWPSMLQRQRGLLQMEIDSDPESDTRICREFDSTQSDDAANWHPRQRSDFGDDADLEQPNPRTTASMRPRHGTHFKEPTYLEQSHPGIPAPIRTAPEFRGPPILSGAGNGGPRHAWCADGSTAAPCTPRASMANVRGFAPHPALPSPPASPSPQPLVGSNLQGSTESRAGAMLNTSRAASQMESHLIAAAPSMMHNQAQTDLECGPRARASSNSNTTSKHAATTSTCRQRPTTAFASQSRSQKASTVTESHDACETSQDSSFASFAQRNEVWELQRARRCQELRRQREAEEAAACSFQPSLSARPSSRSGHHSHGQRSNLNIVSKRQVVITSASCLADKVEAVTERLTKPSQFAHRQSVEAAQWKDRREQEDLQECTFCPDLSKSSISYRQWNTSNIPSANISTCDGVSEGASQLSSTEGGGSARADQQDGRENAPNTGVSFGQFCRLESPTMFAPQTNPVPLSMLNARSYLQNDVFTRLTQPTTAVETSEDGAGSVSSSVIGRSRSDASLLDRGDHGSCRHGDVFIDFLHRQNALEENRRERLAKLEADNTAPWRPQLNERSKHLAARRKQREQQRHHSAGSIHKLHVGAGGKVQFIEHASKTAEAQRYVKRSGGVQAEPAQDKECTFKPKITALAAKLEPRGTDMLAYKDKERRDKKVEKLREEQQRKEEKDAVEQFKPHVNDYNGVESRLKGLLEDPDHYVEKINRLRHTELVRCQKDAQNSREEEERELTFKPKIHPAPEFVRRMAESFRTARAFREKENHATMECFDSCAAVGGTKDSQSQHQARPDWR